MKFRVSFFAIRYPAQQSHMDSPTLEIFSSCFGAWALGPRLSAVGCRMATKRKEVLEWKMAADLDSCSISGIV